MPPHVNNESSSASRTTTCLHQFELALTNHDLPPQWPGDRHADQLDFHRAAAVPGRRDGLGHDSSGDPGHWIR